MVYVERVLGSIELVLWTIEHALHTHASTHAQAQTPHLREAHLHAVLKVKTGRSVAKPTHSVKCMYLCHHTCTCFVCEYLRDCDWVSEYILFG